MAPKTVRFSGVTIVLLLSDTRWREEGHDLKQTPTHTRRTARWLRKRGSISK